MHENRKVVFITGAARRIGAEIARTLHETGMNIVLHCHSSRTEAEQLCADLNKKREDSAIVVCADLKNVANFNQLIKQTVQKWQRLDILVNNASQFYKTIGETTEKAWDDLLNTNLKAPFFLAEAAAPYLKKQQGCIVNITDIHGEQPIRDYSVYCISKAGLIMLTKVLAKELSPDVRVNAVSPGAIIWPEGENTLTEKLKQKIIENIPLRKHGDPNDIAKAVVYFVNASYVTGQILAVDGGRMLSS